MVLCFGFVAKVVLTAHFWLEGDTTGTTDPKGPNTYTIYMWYIHVYHITTCSAIKTDTEEEGDRAFWLPRQLLLRDWLGINLLWEVVGLCSTWFWFFFLFSCYKTKTCFCLNPKFFSLLFYLFSSLAHWREEWTSSWVGTYLITSLSAPLLFKPSPQPLVLAGSFKFWFRCFKEEWLQLGLHNGIFFFPFYLLFSIDLFVLWMIVSQALRNRTCYVLAHLLPVCLGHECTECTVGPWFLRCPREWNSEPIVGFFCFKYCLFLS